MSIKPDWKGVGSKKWKGDLRKARGRIEKLLQLE